MNQEKIYDIETKVAELKFLERDLIRDRNVGRLRSLDKAEKSETVEKVINKIFITSLNVERKNLIINSYPTKFSGRDGEEFMSEVRVEIIFRPDTGSIDYNELTLSVYLNNGFQDVEVREMEKRIMDRLMEIRKEVDELKESKKSLKQNI